MSASKKRKVDAVVEAIDEAKRELDEREHALEQREEALSKAIEGVAHEKKLMAGRKPDDVLSLNIGGTRCQVMRKTLCLYDGSMLAAHFSGRWDESIETDAEGAFFIDQPYELFLPLINYLRDKRLEIPSMPVKSPTPECGYKSNGSTFTDTVVLGKFHRLVEYYGMTPFVYPLRFTLHRGTSSNNVVSASGAQPSVQSELWATFTLERDSHERGRVTRFEVTLDAMERPQIGWLHRSQFPLQLVPATMAEPKGLGEELASIALDGFRGGVCFMGSLIHPVPQLSLQAGSVVACEECSASFRWLVDGNEVAVIQRSTLHIGNAAEEEGSEEEEEDESLSNYLDHPHEPIPGVSGKGQWHLSQFTYG